MAADLQQRQGGGLSAVAPDCHDVCLYRSQCNPDSPTTPARQHAGMAQHCDATHIASTLRFSLRAMLIFLTASPSASSARESRLRRRGSAEHTVGAVATQSQNRTVLAHAKDRSGQQGWSRGAA